MYPLCVDDDKCQMGTHNCSYKEDFVNEFRFFSCLCIEGFELQPDGSCDGTVMKLLSCTACRLSLCLVRPRVDERERERELNSYT